MTMETGTCTHHEYEIRHFDVTDLVHCAHVAFRRRFRTGGRHHHAPRVRLHESVAQTQDSIIYGNEYGRWRMSLFGWISFYAKVFQIEPTTSGKRAML